MILHPHQWPSDVKLKLLLKTKGQLKRFLNVVLRISFDHSIQITLDGDKIKKALDLSYHPTGLVNFKWPHKRHSRHFEPLYQITQSNDIFIVSIRDIALLDDVSNQQKGNHAIFDWPSGVPLTIVGSILPHSVAELHKSSIIGQISTPSCAVCFLLGDDPVYEADLISFPGIGTNPSGFTNIAKEDAYVRMRIAMNPGSDLLLFGPNGEHEYELTFPASFARRPSGLINPSDLNLMIRLVLYERHRLRFHVTDRVGRIIREPVGFVIGDERNPSQWWPIAKERFMSRP